MAEKLVEAGAEMAARLDDDDPGLGDVEPHHFQEDGVGALGPDRDDDGLDAAEIQESGRPKVHAAARVKAAATNAIAIFERQDRRLGLSTGARTDHSPNSG